MTSTVSGKLRTWVYNTDTGEVHERKGIKKQDNLPEDYYEKENYQVIKARNEDTALKQARKLWAAHSNMKEPDLCGHEFPEKSAK